MTIDSLKHLALIAEQAERFDEALNLYRLALAHAEETGNLGSVPPLQVRAAEMLVRLNKGSAGIPLFERAGQAYAERGMIEEVREIGRYVRRADPDNVAVFDGWTATLIQHGYFEEARALQRANGRESTDDERPTAPAEEIDVANAPTRIVPGIDPAAIDPPPIPDPRPEDRPTTQPRALPPDMGVSPRSGDTAPPMLAQPAGPKPEDLFAPTPTNPQPPRSERAPTPLLVPRPFVRDTPMASERTATSDEIRTVRVSNPEPIFRRRRRLKKGLLGEMALWAIAAIAAGIMLASLLF